MGGFKNLRTRTGTSAAIQSLLTATKEDTSGREFGSERRWGEDRELCARQKGERAGRSWVHGDTKQVDWLSVH